MISTKHQNFPKMAQKLTEEEEGYHDDSSPLPDSGPRVFKILPKWVSKASYYFDKEHYCYAGHQIIIQESIECFGAVVWPAEDVSIWHLKALSRPLLYVSTWNPIKRKLTSKKKKVLEIGAGTGLVSIVASVLGAFVTATDLPEVLENLEFNITRNIQNLAIHKPEVRKLIWGMNLPEDFPKATHHYDFIVATDVVYHHTALDSLLDTFRYLCQPGTTLLWANKFRFSTDYEFLDSMSNIFNITQLAEFPESSIKLFKGTIRELR